MMKNFWTKLPRPFFCLAPMADVTDAAFRRIIAKCGKPDVLFTEFVSADGLCHPKGRERLLIDLQYSEIERPIVAQLFTARPEKMHEAAKIVLELGFDGLDINMGCPDRTVEKQGAGAALIKNHKLAQEVIWAAQRGAPKLPISVKTRLGYHRDELDPPSASGGGGWLPALLETGLAAVTLHARTRKEMSKAPAHWEAIARAVKIRDDLKSGTLIIGNGDVADLNEARRRATETGADGIMLGRAIFGNPWLFKGETLGLKGLTLGERLRVLVEHAKLFEELLGGVKSFALMKKHYKCYVAGWEGTNELRQELMGAPDAAAVARVVDPVKSGALLRG
ncbi:MAG: tRNA-dihydrouridine synthase [Candidatus Vogelbacteria bacterium]|nr:tRNA-dihydrouridine synthase [Candidatus Vogelbacteria bacterium]